MVGDAAMLTKKARPSRKLRVPHQKAGCTRFDSNQVPLIPASRGHNYATTYPRPLPGSLPYPSLSLPPFFSPPPSSQVRAQQQTTTVQRSGCSRPTFVHDPDLLNKSAHIYPVSPSLYSCALWPCARHRLSTFRTRFPHRGSRRDKGVLFYIGTRLGTSLLLD